MVIMVVPGVIVEYFLVVLVQGHPHVGASTAIHSIESEEVGTCYRCCEETCGAGKQASILSMQL